MTNKTIAGRVELIKSVLFFRKGYSNGGVEIMLVFLEREMRRIVELRVSWPAIGLLNNRGGLGNQRLDEWNKATVLHSLWNLSLKDCRAWVAIMVELRDWIGNVYRALLWPDHRCPFKILKWRISQEG